MNNVVERFRGFINHENDTHSIINEWNELVLFDDFPDYLRDNIEISTFWFEMYYYRNEAGEFVFRNLAHFVLHILIIPHSNVEPERIWSKVKLEKNKRNGFRIYFTSRSLL